LTTGDAAAVGTAGTFVVRGEAILSTVRTDAVLAVEPVLLERSGRRLISWEVAGWKV
jgi:hypothetical protein